MSAGLSMIAALLAEGSRSGMRRLRDIHFVGDEVAAWEFLRGYYTTYGHLPAPELFAENGLRLTAARGTFEYYLDWCQRRAIYNALQESHRPFMDAMHNQQMDAAIQAMNEMQRAVADVQVSDSVHSRREWAQGVADMYAAARAREAREGITLGWDPLNQWTGGAQPGDVVALVGRPSEGKTYTLAYMALQAWLSGRRVALRTLEMTDAQIATRMVGLRTRIAPEYIRRGQLSGFMLPAFNEAVAEFSAGDGPEFYIMGGSMRGGVAEIDAMVQELRPDILFIDASYLLRPEGGARNRSRWELLADVGESIKDMALARAIPVVHSVQFNRQARNKARTDHDLSMIGGTDVIGQVASIVLGIRPGVTPYQRTRRKLTLMKNREGPVGSFTTNFLFQPIDFSLVGVDSDDGAQMTEEQAAQRARDMQALRDSQL